MTFWSGETLAIKLPEQRIVEPFNIDQIDCAAYLLRIGREIYISPTTDKWLGKNTICILKDKESFTIPPGQFAFLSTEETIAIPEDTIAFISMRAKLKFKGLVNVSGFHVDPGYAGTLIFAVFNAGPTIVHLRRGDPVFMIWFAYLDMASNKIKHARGYTTELVNQIAGPILSLDGLDKRIKRIEKVQTGITAITTVVVSILLAIVTYFVLPSIKEYISSHTSAIEIEQPAPQTKPPSSAVPPK
jgi:dCTP deaminase